MTITDNKTSNTEELIGMLFSGRRFPADFIESLQAWLIEWDDTAEDKDIVLEECFDRMVRTADSRKYAEESWPELAGKLGIDPGSANRNEAAYPLRRKQPQRRLIHYAAAAVLTGATIVSAFLLAAQWNARYHSASSAAFSVAASPDRNVISLPDGSSAVIRENTSLTYPADFINNRSVVLDGEAFFTVARDQKHRFTVEGRDITALVEGTEFNMRAFDEENGAEVTLVTGSVTVTSGGKSITLKPGEKISVDRERGVMEIMTAEGGELSRLRGEGLSLRGVSLAEAFAGIGSYFGVKMEVPAGLPRVDGIVLDLGRGATLEDAMFLLQAINPVFDYRIADSTVSITGR